MGILKGFVGFFCVLVVGNNLLWAQGGGNELLYQKGLKARENFQYNEGFALFQILLKSDSGNVDYLSNMSYFYSRVGQLQATEGMRMPYYRTAEYLGLKAIKVGPNDDEAHFSYVLALGRLNEHASSKQKINNAKRIKSELDICLRLNPKHDGAWHILGVYHRTIAGFNGFEKLAINSLFGGVPEGCTYEDAIRCLEKAVEYRKNYMFHHYDLALTYYERGKPGDKARAREVLETTLALPNFTQDDPENRKKCEALLKKVE